MVYTHTDIHPYIRTHTFPHLLLFTTMPWTAFNQIGTFLHFFILCDTCCNSLKPFLDLICLTLQTGGWNYTITNTGSSGQVISVKVTSQSSDPDVYPVTVDVFWSESNLDVSEPGHVPQALFATVSKGINGQHKWMYLLH